MEIFMNESIQSKKVEKMCNQRANNILVKREYIGDFQGASMLPKAKHTLEVDIRANGGACLLLNYSDIKQNQTSHAIHLTGEQRKNLSEFLVPENPIMWVDHPPEKY